MAIQLAPRGRQSFVPVFSDEPSQRYWFSCEKVTRFRGVTCVVRRTRYVSRPVAFRASTLSSSRYPHFVGSPAYALAKTPSTAWADSKLRKLPKNHSRSRLIGPP